MEVREAIQRLRAAAERLSARALSTNEQHRRGWLNRQAEAAVDIANRVEQRGSWFSQRQAAYAASLITWGEEQPRVPVSSPVVAAQPPADATTTVATTVTAPFLQRVFRLFTVARERGLRHPRITLRLDSADNGAVRDMNLSRAPDYGRHPNNVYVTVGRGRGRAHQRYVGRIDESGTFVEQRGGIGVFDRADHDNALAAARAMLDTFGADPLAAARAHGRLTGACCFCRRTLTDERSVAMGYGPVCADRFGLEWGERRAEGSVTLSPEEAQEALQQGAMLRGPAAREQVRREATIRQMASRAVGSALQNSPRRPVVPVRGVAQRIDELAREQTRQALRRQEQEEIDQARAVENQPARPTLPDDDEDRHFL